MGMHFLQSATRDRQRTCHSLKLAETAKSKIGISSTGATTSHLTACGELSPGLTLITVITMCNSRGACGRVVRQQVDVLAVSTPWRRRRYRTELLLGVAPPADPPRARRDLAGR
jgi:hypothetical protein